LKLLSLSHGRIGGSMTFQKYSLIILTFLGLMIFSPKGLTKIQKNTPNQQQYLKIRDEVKNFNSIYDLNILSKYHILIVGGSYHLFTQNIQHHLLSMGIEDTNQDPLFFTFILKWLNNFGIQFSFIQQQNITTSNLIRKNIIQTIKDSRRPVIILTHGKGGVDTLNTLLDSPNNLLKKVKGWISLEAPFHGSSIIDIITESKWSNFQSFILKKSQEQHTDFFSPLSTKRSKSYLRKNDEKIKNLSKKLPIISLGTWISPRKGQSNYLDLTSTYLNIKKAKDLLQVIQPLLFSYENENNTFVSIESSCLPYSKCLFEQGLSHGEIVSKIENSSSAEEKIIILRSLFYLLLGDISSNKF